MPKAHNKKSENLAIAEKYMQALETKNVMTMDSLLSENYISYVPSVGVSANKAEALSAWNANAENLYEFFQCTLHKELDVSVNEGEAVGDWFRTGRISR